MFWGFSLGPVILVQPAGLLAKQGQRQARLSSWGLEVPSLALLGGLFQRQGEKGFPAENIQTGYEVRQSWEPAVASGTDAVDLSSPALSCR